MTCDDPVGAPRPRLPTVETLPPFGLVTRISCPSVGSIAKNVVPVAGSRSELVYATAVNTGTRPKFTSPIANM